MGSSSTKSKDTNMSSENTSRSSSSMGNEENTSNTSNTRPLSIQAPRSQNESRQPQFQPIPNQPRQPTNLQGLLRFAMEATRNEDAPSASNFQPLDQERQRFLNDALTSMTVNVIEELQKSIKVLLGASELRAEDDPSEYDKALEVIANYVDNMDTANDFYKIGGFTIFGPCLNSTHSSLRWRAADIIAELTQNNPYCQEKILEAGLMPILLNMVDTDPSEQTRIKALYAVSCLVREYPISLRHLDVNDGYSVLLRAMQSPVEKLQIKSAFLLSSLCSKDENIDNMKTTLVKMGLIEQAAGLLAMQSLPCDTRDQLLRVLAGLANNNYLPALRECRRPELCLRQTLERLRYELKAEESVDEAVLCTQLLDQIFSDCETGQER
ncbi:hsp70-binding protein 1-like isoform X1 [Athalia rosae]|uniref:hsp70-binding protein 1-like isoform X1 n=2 Tax=Athalia rosae TaxID=37344 RepID=UPI002033D4DF|nr:hsp70-binding protein 1-like isoform X1 [Athalia rosae]